MLEISCNEQFTDKIVFSGEESNLVEVSIRLEYGRKNALVYIDKHDAIEIIKHLQEQFNLNGD